MNLYIDSDTDLHIVYCRKAQHGTCGLHGRQQGFFGTCQGWASVQWGDSILPAERGEFQQLHFDYHKEKWAMLTGWWPVAHHSLKL